MDIFSLCRLNRDLLLDLLEETRGIDEYALETLLCERDDRGRTALHIAATYGCDETLLLLLNYGSDHTLQDWESGWTPLHRALYNGHLRCALLLMKSGALLGDEIGKPDWKTEVRAMKQPRRSIRNIKSWISPFDHDGKSPLDLLSAVLSNNLSRSKQCLDCTDVLSFGRAGYPLGYASINAAEVIRPTRIDDLSTEKIVAIEASKFHSLAVSKSGRVFAWGYGKSGRLGHGNEENRQSPTQIASLRNHNVVKLAAADSHTLAITSAGAIFAWGSNAHGQLGIEMVSLVMIPTKIDFFRKTVVVGCSAGSYHSVCHTDDGELYAWGSNKSGQCAFLHEKSNQQNITIPRKVVWDRSIRQRNQLYSSVILQISAGHESTLLLCKSSSLVNEVYQWGHGSSIPSKVFFKQRRKNSFGSFQEGHEISFGGLHAASVVQIATGHTHNVALTDAGHVYTWGLGSDQLGHGNSDTHTSIPLLVESLLPDKGGGKVKFISACANRTACITETGDLFTWGSTHEKGVLGQGPGSSFTPTPRRVLGVKRCIRVSVGADHTLILLSSYKPDLPYNSSPLFANPLPSHRTAATPGESLDISDCLEDSTILQTELPTSVSPLSLSAYCQRVAAQGVDFKNAIQVLAFSERTYSEELAEFTRSFIRNNLDLVLIQSRPTDVAILLEELNLCLNKVNPLKADNISKKNDQILAPIPTRKVSSLNADDDEFAPKRTGSIDETITRERSKSKDLDNLQAVLKLAKSINKKLSSIQEAELSAEQGNVLLPDQLEKISKKDALKSELSRLQPVIKRLENEERIRQAAESRRVASPADTKEYQVAPLANPAQPFSNQKVPRKKNKFMTLNAFSAQPGTSSAVVPVMPSFTDWGQSAIAAVAPAVKSASVTDTISKGVAWKTIPSVPKINEADAIPPVLQSPPPKAQSNVCGRDGAESPVRDTGGLTLATFMSPPLKTKLSGDAAVVHPGSSGKAPWSLSSDSKNKFKSLSQIQEEEEIVRMNSSIGALRGNENPWFIERRLRTDSFENIVESQMKQQHAIEAEEKRLLADNLFQKSKKNSKKKA